MHAVAIRFLPGSHAPARLTISADSATAFAHSTAGPRPAAYVVSNADLEAMLSSSGIGSKLNDRGRKHPAKGLKGLLLGRKPIAALRGSYRDAGQLARSVRTLLDHARRAGDREIYLIGADAEVVDTLWSKAEPRRDGRSSRGGATSGDGALGDGALDRPPSLLDLLEPIEVPAELEARFVGHSHQAQLVRQLVLRAARSSEPVLILGASGTGKEVVARSVHDFGDRRAEPFIAVNCGGIPSELLESELFGHERGAFTGALRKKPGLWKVASAGTLFLDEIGDLTKGHQAKLLRALQEGLVRPVGAEREVPVRARVLAATNRDLYAMVRGGEFREDLYYRLRAFTIETPSLHEHPEDIPILTAWFWRQVTGRAGARLPARLADLLTERPWPGNARELRSVLANLHALFGDEGLDAGHLTAVLRLHGYDSGAPSSSRVRARLEGLRTRDVLLRLEDAVLACRSVLAPLRKQRTASTQLERVRSALEQRIQEIRAIAAAAEVQDVELGARCERSLARVRGEMVELAAALEVDPRRARARFIRESSPALDELVECARAALHETDHG